VLIMGASGGDMAMTADVARTLDLDFAPIPKEQAAALQELLTERVTVANPLDIHTYLWFDPPALERVFRTAMRSGYDAVGFMLDFPPEGKADASSFDAAIDAYIRASRGAPSRVALISSLPEALNARVRKHCLEGGIVPLQGQREALEALAAAAAVGIAWSLGTGVELRLPPQPAANAPAGDVHSLDEAEGKAALARHGVAIPRSRVVAAGQAASCAEALGFPVVIKAVGAHLEHKTEVGGVALNIRSAMQAGEAAHRLSTLAETLLVEEMIGDGVAEVLVGLILDPQFGQVLVVGAGGVLTELLADSFTLLPPFSPDAVRGALGALKIAKLLDGFRGKPRGDVDALVEVVLGIARYAAAQLSTLQEIDVNPVIVRPAGLGAVAVDVLIRLKSR
jgi:acyl-CoA synthetase (NDP forming)